MTICTATRTDGTPCTLRALPSGAQCFAHSPHLASARVKGGQQSSRTERAAKMLPATLRPLLADLLDLYGETQAGTIEAERARACATVAGAIVKVLEAGQFEERLRAMEGRIAAAQVKR